MNKVFRGFLVDEGINPAQIMNARKNEVLQAYMWAWLSGFEVYAESSPDGWHVLAYIQRFGIPESLTIDKSLPKAINTCVQKALGSM